VGPVDSGQQLRRWPVVEDTIASGSAARSWREAAVDRIDPEGDSGAEARDDRRSFLADPNGAEEDTGSAKCTRKESDDSRAHQARCQSHEEGATYGKRLPLQERRVGHRVLARMMIDCVGSLVT